MTRVLLEPFSVALENDRRLREMEALREAAEADKRSLLTRLGRRQLADTIVGAEAGLGAVMERVELVARSDAPVLIFGETGTGKELIARAIHGRSNRSAGPFHRVNCGAIPPELIDSQLFGHEQGAFTGAVEMRRGWFERADGGTLFLDEIGELPLAAQVRLLRILQDGQLERVGGQKAIHVDVRIVAATHCDLAGMVTEGRFREDLWYRIAVFPMFLPPLRERRDDIPALAQHLAERAATRFGLPLASPSAEDVRTAGVLRLAGQRPRVGGGDRSGGDPGQRKTPGGDHRAGHHDRPADLDAGAGTAAAGTRAGRRGDPAAGRRHAPAHRAGPGGHARPHRGPPRRGPTAGDQSPYPPRPDAKLGINWQRFRPASAPTQPRRNRGHAAANERGRSGWTLSSTTEPAAVDDDDRAVQVVGRRARPERRRRP